MKKIVGYVAAFIAGSLFTGTTAIAATKYVQAQLGNAVYNLNGHTVEKAPKLIYGGTTYVQLYSIQQALHQAGIGATWNGSKNPGVFNMTTSQTTSSKSGSQQAATKTQFPLSVSYPDGMKVIINSVNANSSGTTLNITVANNGTIPDADPEAFMMETSLSDGGPAVKLVSDADTDVSSPNNTAYNQLPPGESVDDTLTFEPLATGATGFTWYFQDFDGNTHGIHVQL